MHHDPDTYPDPDEFRPERFLDESGHIKPAIPDTYSHGHNAFGFGRRSVLALGLLIGILISFYCLL